jgi:linoleoyl-CoA desaturase
MSLTTVRFNNKLNAEFVKAVRTNVNRYFKENNISRFANLQMKIKTVAMLCIYFIPFIVMLTAGIELAWVHYLLWLLMGIGMGGIGLSVMHDANHGAYSKNPKVNKWIGNVIVLVGGYSPNWKFQHNVLHHSYTNVEGHDEDIDPGNLLRFSPHAKHFKAHRFQHIYAWLLYSLMTIVWATTKDFKQLVRYRSQGMEKYTGKSFGTMLTEVILTKILYYAYIIGLPLLFAPVSWIVIVTGWLLMQLTAGFILAIIFQPAHVIPTSEYPVPDDAGVIEENWAIHQLHTTSNFAPNNKWLSWFVGGLNFQVEHHLFPNICHVHYKKIAGIVEKTAKDFGLPYYSQPTFRSAIIEHGKMLKKLGSNEPLAPSV